MEEGFSALEACQITGVTYRQLDYWDRTRAIEPDLVPASGSGNSKRRYSLDGLCLLALARRLMNLGAKVSVLGEVARSLDGSVQLWNEVVVVQPSGTVFPLNEWDGSSGWLIDMVAVKEQVTARAVPDLSSLVP